MVEIETLEGPLESTRLKWVADLYGPVDPKYRDRAQLEHLFVNVPAAPALHAFALDASRPVGHCAIVPMTARHGNRAFLAGKVEALVVDEAYRGRLGRSPPVALRLREELYESADARGIELLHAYVRPEVGRILDLVPLHVAARSFVAVLKPSSVAARRLRAPAIALSLGQATLRAGVGAVVGSSAAAERAPITADGDLVRVPAPPEGRWTVIAEDAWDWYCAAPSVRVLELDDSRDSRALVQMPGSPGDAIRLVAWRAESPSLTSALRAVRALAQFGTSSGAGTLRYQPWLHGPGMEVLIRACRLLGLVRRDGFATIYVRARDPALARAESVISTPLLALGF